jgi:hypothetical protein
MPTIPQTHQFGDPNKKVHALKKNYDMFYRGQIVKECTNVHYAVCNKKRTDLLMTGNYTLSFFTIKPHK